MITTKLSLINYFRNARNSVQIFLEWAQLNTEETDANLGQEEGLPHLSSLSKLVHELATSSCWFKLKL